MMHLWVLVLVFKHFVSMKKFLSSFYFGEKAEQVKIVFIKCSTLQWAPVE